MDHPAGFAGRRKQILGLVDSLISTGACPIIYGERGLGKTSIAYQLARIALGDVELLEEFGVGERALEESDRPVPFIIRCSDAIQNKDDLLQRLINQAIGYKTLESFDSREVTSISSKEKINLKFYESETVKNFSPERIREYAKLNLEDQVLAVVDSLHSAGVRRILFIIDELDRVQDTTGLASFIKNCSDDDIKFLLVGVAQNISIILADHASLERQLHPIRVLKMEKDELEEIVNKTSEYLRQHGSRMTFSPQATERLVSAANGFPWFIHVLGREAIISVFDDSREQVEETDVVSAIQSLGQNQFAQQFQDTYQSAVKESYHREALLRVMAKWSGEDIFLSEVYHVARKLRVSNPSIYKKDLTSKKCGSVISTPPHGLGKIVRFRNGMFKQYINLRKSIFQGLDDTINSNWKNWLEHK